jgi:hypothetical protein
MTVTWRTLRYERLSRTGYRVRIGYWARWETERYMVPMRQLRNPFAGRRRWTLALGKLALRWY